MRRLSWKQTDLILECTNMHEDDVPVVVWENIGISERNMAPVQAWCIAHSCGVRTSFDTFKFKNQKEISMFLLRWA
jgi:hypothetical protein